MSSHLYCHIQKYIFCVSLIFLWEYSAKPSCVLCRGYHAFSGADEVTHKVMLFSIM